MLTALALIILGAVGADVARRVFFAPQAAHGTLAREITASAAGSSPTPAADSASLRRAEVRDRIATDGERTYIGPTLSETDSTIRRWPDNRFERPLQVAILRRRIDGYRDDFASNVSWALTRWNGVLALSLVSGADSAAADIVVTWTTQLDSGKTGRTDLIWDQRGNIHHAFVTLATHDANGRLLDAPRMSALALHELGHALGLGHSPDKLDALYPIATSLELTDRDRRTARLLYDLPPGSLR